MKFRNKPKVIDAVRASDAIRWATNDWLRTAYDSKEKGKGIIFRPDGVDICTLEGVMTAGRDDWIIRGIAGELYPCKPEIFAQSYEPE